MPGSGEEYNARSILGYIGGIWETVLPISVFILRSKGNAGIESFKLKYDEMVLSRAQRQEETRRLLFKEGKSA